MPNPKQKPVIEQVEMRPFAVDTDTAAAMIGIAPGTLENWRYSKKGPKGPVFARVEGRVVYPLDELERYIRESIVR